MSDRIRVDVVLCTHRFNPVVLSKVLNGLTAQTHSSNQWNITIVNNLPQDTRINHFVEKFYPDLRASIIDELQPGLIHARIAAMKKVKSDLIIFCDDDTILDPKYVENALKIADSEPGLGAFGGKSIGKYNKEPKRWVRDLEGHIAVRDYGEEPITSGKNEWGKWEPIGAGFVVRRSVWERFIKFCDENKSSLGLGRAGSKLMSGEDSLLARMSYRVGLQCGYRPELTLMHMIPSSRTTLSYICRILQGHGASFFYLQRLLENTAPYDLSWKYIIKTFARRWHQEGLSGFVRTYWEVGYKQESDKYNEN